LKDYDRKKMDETKRAAYNKTKLKINLIKLKRQKKHRQTGRKAMVTD
jgi:hypothetical protein